MVWVISLPVGLAQLLHRCVLCFHEDSFFFFWSLKKGGKPLFNNRPIHVYTGPELLHRLNCVLFFKLSSSHLQIEFCPLKVFKEPQLVLLWHPSEQSFLSPFFLMSVYPALQSRGRRFQMFNIKHCLTASFKLIKLSPLLR